MTHTFVMILNFGPLKTEVVVDKFPHDYQMKMLIPGWGEVIASATEAPEVTELPVWTLIFEIGQHVYTLGGDNAITEYRNYWLTQIT